MWLHGQPRACFHPHFALNLPALQQRGSTLNATAEEEVIPKHGLNHLVLVGDGQKSESGGTIASDSAQQGQEDHAGIFAELDRTQALNNRLSDALRAKAILVQQLRFELKASNPQLQSAQQVNKELRAQIADLRATLHARTEESQSRMIEAAEARAAREVRWPAGRTRCIAV